MSRATFATQLLVGGLLLAGAGCAKTPTEDSTLATDADELQMAGLTDSGHWQSAPWSGGPWIALPALSTVRVPHGLGRVPAEVHVYLSFVEDDRGDQNPREFFIGAGDLANVGAVTDTELTVHNTTRGDEYFFRVVVQ